MRDILQQFRRGEQAYIPPSLQTEVLNALFDDVLEQEPSESVGWVDEMLVVHEEEKTMVLEERPKNKKERKGKKKSAEGAKSRRESGKAGGFESGSRKSERVFGQEDAAYCDESERVHRDGNELVYCDGNELVYHDENELIRHDENELVHRDENELIHNENELDHCNENNETHHDEDEPKYPEANEAIPLNNEHSLIPNSENIPNELPTDHLNKPATPSQENTGDQRVSWLESLIEPAPVDAHGASLLHESSGDLGFGLQGLLAPFPQEATKEPLGTPGLFSEQFGFLGNELDLFGRKETPEQMGFFGGEEKGGIIDMLQGSSRDLETAPSLLQIARDNRDREEKERMKKVAEEKEKRRLEAIARAEAKKSNVDLPESTIKKTGMGLKPRSIMLRKRKWPVCLKCNHSALIRRPHLLDSCLFPRKCSELNVLEFSKSPHSNSFPSSIPTSPTI